MKGNPVHLYSKDRSRTMRTVSLIMTLLIFTASRAFGQSSGIHKAAYEGDINKVRELLKKGVNADDRDSFG
jgi:hypothetical protein